MKKNYSLNILLFLILWVLAPLVYANKLVLNDIDWPPYLFSESKHNLSGLGKDVLNECLPKKNFTLTYSKLPIKRTHLYMQSGELDISLYSYKKEREAFVVYGKVPIFTTEYGFAMRADSKVDIHKIEDLHPLIIGHLAGLTYTPELLALIDKKRLVGEISEGHSIDAMFAQLLSSNPRFDIMPNSKQTFYWRAKTLGVADKIKVPKFTVSFRDYFVTVSKNSKNITDTTGFLTSLDSCITQMHNDGRYLALLKKYGLENLAQPKSH
ncbi:ABC transporter substrate-binding protein [uncultured Paraglaciecola sp.]|jgi:ABC-type amino acid transport substrate-binding protein|uniref:substrate-binding periplasmic protein n=1 Tax=uncultured Paraglaciecola sp. TaxID=1765024 RepID=UPI0025F14CC7|nr:ABC transporter substrate-binding protein [uncultured Paraglaciecola sp.]